VITAMKKNSYPTFFVIGTQKAGTTTLHDLLQHEPNVELPSIKETHFFCDDERHSRGMEWYLKWFDDKGPDAVRGEIDPDYLFFHQSAERISQIVPEPKIVIILRNPIDRAYSQYRMSQRRGLETLPFARALAEEPQRLAKGTVQALKHYSYAARGRYAEQIERWKTALPRAAFLFIRFEDFVKPETRSEAYRRICNFIGTRVTLTPADMDVVSNPASVPKSDILTGLLWGDTSLKRLLRPIVRILLPKKDMRGRFATMLDQWNRRPAMTTQEDWQSILPTEILTDFRAEIREAEAATGMDLSDWHVGRQNSENEGKEFL